MPKGRKHVFILRKKLTIESAKDNVVASSKLRRIDLSHRTYGYLP